MMSVSVALKHFHVSASSLIRKVIGNKGPLTAERSQGLALSR